MHAIHARSAATQSRSCLYSVASLPRAGESEAESTRQLEAGFESMGQLPMPWTGPVHTACIGRYCTVDIMNVGCAAYLRSLDARLVQSQLDVGEGLPGRRATANVLLDSHIAKRGQKPGLPACAYVIAGSRIIRPVLHAGCSRPRRSCMLAVQPPVAHIRRLHRHNDRLPGKPSQPRPRTAPGPSLPDMHQPVPAARRSPLVIGAGGTKLGSSPASVSTSPRRPCSIPFTRGGSPGSV